MVATWRRCATMADNTGINFNKEGRDSSFHGVTNASFATGTIFVKELDSSTIKCELFSYS
jgi:hypothetical protein